MEKKGNQLTIEQAREAKQILESGIADLARQFSEKTGLSIQGVSLRGVQEFGTRSYTTYICELEVPLI